MVNISFTDKIKIPEDIYEVITSVVSFEDALDFDKASEGLFRLIREENKSTNGVIHLGKMQEVAFNKLISSIIDVVKSKTDSYIESVLKRSDSFIGNAVGIAELKRLIQEIDGYILSEYNYFDSIKRKFDYENCELPASISDNANLFIYYFNEGSVPKLELCIGELEKQMRAMTPIKIGKSSTNQAIISQYIVSCSELTNCYDLNSLLDKRYTINSRVCKRIGVSKELVLEFVNSLVDLLNDDNCPKELFDMFFSVFSISIPKMLSSSRGSLFKKCDIENTIKIEDALNNYKVYKKSGCFIEVVKV